MYGIVLFLDIDDFFPSYSQFVIIHFFIYKNCLQEVADNNCVYRNEIHHAVGERTQVLQDVAADPTLPRTKAVRCAQCNHGEAVFFQVHFLLPNFDLQGLSTSTLFLYSLDC